MAFYDEIDEHERKMREAELNAQYGYQPEDEEEQKDWLNKIVEYLRQKKAEDARKAGRVT